jgi:2-polyprenyl-3-methyl-5-hydroxy-6-metoxy-1,4-benzoquinol methylase
MTDRNSNSAEAFDSNWRRNLNNSRYHFKRGKPENQIQFAFQNHWRVFRNLLGGVGSGKVLEVGCGRGSMAAFFADEGFDVHLLDISETALRMAKMNYRADGLTGHYVCGNALALPYPSGMFDVVLSIGLLEHFAEVDQLLCEEVRILKPGGVLLGYVVPEKPLSIQRLVYPVNMLLRLVYTIYRGLRSSSKGVESEKKAPLYRNNYGSERYLSVLHALGVKEAGSLGMFPFPLISYSPDFPFSLMAPSLERGLVWLWQLLLTARSWQGGDPWTCTEHWGLAFLVWAKKGKDSDAKG